MEERLNKATEQITALVSQREAMQKEIDDLKAKLNQNNQQLGQFNEIKVLIKEIFTQNKIEIPSFLQEQQKQVDPKVQNEIAQKFSIDSILGAGQSQVQPKTPGSKLTLETVQKLFKEAAESCRDEYCNFISNNKKDRRAIKNTDQDKYLDIVLKYVNESDTILKKSADKLLEKNNYTEQDLEVFLQTLYQQGQMEKFAQLQMETSRVIKGNLQNESKTEFSKDQIKEIFRHEISVFKENEAMFKKLFEKLTKDPEIIQKGPQSIPLAIDQILNDFVFEKFSIDQEDLDKMINAETFQNDQEFQILLLEMQNEMQKFMIKSGFGGPGGYMGDGYY